MARAKITGDFAELREMQEALAGIRRLMADTSQSLAEESITLISAGFRGETDPYGDMWQKKQAADGRKTLSGKTSRLKNTWHVAESNARGFAVASGVDYARPHQSPGRRLDGELKRPRRMMIPDDGLGLPSSWVESYNETALEALIDHFQIGEG